MKIMQVSLSIDVQDPKQKEALAQFMDALSGVECTSPGGVTKVAETTEEEKPVRKSRAQRLKDKAEKEAAEKEEESEEEEDDFLGGEEEEDEVKITLPMLREATASKAVKFRAEIKAKLAELGVSNVSSIAEEDFKDYYDFLEKL